MGIQKHVIGSDNWLRLVGGKLGLGRNNNFQYLDLKDKENNTTTVSRPKILWNW